MRSISLNFSFCQNETAVSFDQKETSATFHENLKRFPRSKMFHSFIDFGLNPALSAVSTLKMLQCVHFQRAETDLQEGLVEKYLTVEGLPPGYGPADVGHRQ